MLGSAQHRTDGTRGGSSASIAARHLQRHPLLLLQLLLDSESMIFIIDRDNGPQMLVLNIAGHHIHLRSCQAEVASTVPPAPMMPAYVGISFDALRQCVNSWFASLRFTFFPHFLRETTHYFGHEECIHMTCFCGRKKQKHKVSFPCSFYTLFLLYYYLLPSIAHNGSVS